MRNPRRGAFVFAVEKEPVPVRTEADRQRPSNAPLWLGVLLLFLLLVAAGTLVLWTVPGPVSAGGWTLTGPAVEAQEREEALAIATFRSTVPVLRPVRPGPVFRLGPFRLYRE